jgi:DNA-binding NarL/FixJ family response regulator
MLAPSPRSDSEDRDEQERRSALQRQDGTSVSGTRTGRTSVFILDDHPAIRQAVASALQETDDLTVEGRSGTLQDAIEALKALDPDILILDLALPDGDGITLLKALGEHGSIPTTLVFSVRDELVHAMRALRAGAVGFLSKTRPLSDLLDAIRQVAAGDVAFSRAVLTQVMSGAEGTGPSLAIEELSDREREVFRKLGQGRNVEQIAREMDLGRKTIETYRRRAKEKFGLDSVSQLRRCAVEWIEVEEPLRMGTG